MTKEKQDKLINTGIVIGIAVLIILLIIGVFEYWPKDENPTEYHETVTTASVTTNDKTDETSKPADTTKKDETTADVGTSGVADTTIGAIVTTNETIETTNEGIVTTQGSDSSTEISTKNESTTESVTTGGDSSYSDITTSSPETTVSVTTAPEITTKPETTKSPEVTTKKATTTAKPTTTKSPVTTKSPEVTTKKPSETTQYPQVTVTAPAELTGNGQVMNGVLYAPDGTAVPGTWYYRAGQKVFVVDLPQLPVGTEYRWWGYNPAFQILEFGTYTILTSGGARTFEPDDTHPIISGEGGTIHPPVTIESGTWW